MTLINSKLGKSSTAILTGGNLKKLLLAAGLIFLILGLSLMVALRSQKEKLKKELIWEEVKKEVNKWQISTEFTEGDKAKLVIDYPPDWVNFLEPEVVDVPYSHKFVYVNVTDPHGNESTFEIAYAKPQGYTYLFVYKITLISTNGFTENDLLSGIEKTVAGEVTLTGRYTATLVAALPPGGSPPTSLTFLKEKEVTTTEYEYTNILTPGIAVFSLGAILCFWGAKNSKRRVSHKRVRKR